MSTGLVVVLCSGFGVLGVVAALAISAAENVRIARHTGVDPRVDRDAQREAARQVRGREGQG